MDFYFSWYGNKRRELKNFMHLINVDKYDTFAEPFGGSLAFSRYIFAEHPDKKFLICDIDKDLTRFCNNFHKNKQHIIENVVDTTKIIMESKDKFYEYISQPYSDDIEEFMTQYLFFNKVYGLRKGLYPVKKPCSFYKFNERTHNVDEFFKNNTYENMDFIQHLEKVKNDKRAFVFLDPPYPIDSECIYYKGNNVLKIWTYLIEFMKSCECDFIMILNSNVFMDIIFKDFIVDRYSKEYNTNSLKKENGEVIKNDKGKIIKKSAEHLIISNIKKA